MKIALLVPSRERIDKKLDLVNSIKSTVHDINNIVLYFGIDDDDPTKNDAIKIAEENSFVKIVEIHNEGKILHLGTMWNICAKAANEEILSMIGDDMVFVSKGWDKEIIEEFSSPKCPEDNFKMVYCYDGWQGIKVAANCFIHRRYMDITGYFMREEFPVDMIDIWLQQIYHSFKRLIYRGDIHIEHRHWSFKKSVMDNVVTRIRNRRSVRRSKTLWDETVDARVQEAEKISSVIGIPFNRDLINKNRGFKNEKDYQF